MNKLLNVISLVIVTGLIVSIEARAGCRMNVFVKNSGKHVLEVDNDEVMAKDTAVKVKLGSWRPLRKGYWMLSEKQIRLKPGQRKGDQYIATFGCKKKRRFRINYVCKAGVNRGRNFTTYYPGPSGWARKQVVTINLKLCN